MEDLEYIQRAIKAVQAIQPSARLVVHGWSYWVENNMGERLSETKSNPRRAWAAAVEFLSVRGI